METLSLVKITVLMVAMSFLVNVGVSSKTCEERGVYDCIGGYTAGFSVNASGVENILLHCNLDAKLLECTERWLKKCGGDNPSRVPTLQALGRAVLSYAVFDRKLRVCRYRGYWSLYQLLKNVHVSQFSRCARRVDRQCLNQFVTKMRTAPNLCTNIPFKYNCLKSNKDCKAPILDDILNVFPEEANEVLSKLCQPQDSG